MGQGPADLPHGTSAVRDVRAGRAGDGGDRRRPHRAASWRTAAVLEHDKLAVAVQAVPRPGEAAGGDSSALIGSLQAQQKYACSRIEANSLVGCYFNRIVTMGGSIPNFS